jgi:uncharacterized protein
MKDRLFSVGLKWLCSYPVASFFFLTFLISWSVWGATRVFLPDAQGAIRVAAHTIGLFGPTIAAVIMSGCLYGCQGIRDLLKRIARWRVGIGWYLFALFSTLCVGLAAIGIHSLLGGTRPPLNPVFSIIPALLPLPSGLPEEYGWRGFALPHLMEKRSALSSSLIVAAFWVLWHVPISPILSQISFFGLFLLEVIPLSIFFNWVYINSRGSILLVVLYHLVANCVVNVLNITGSPVLWIIYIGLNWLLAILIVARYGVSTLSRHTMAQVERDLWGVRPNA